MYEALALSMQLTNHPKEEIERTIMSAADFAESPLELMYFAVYLQQNAMHARALKIFREVALMEPMATQAYTLGMRSAQALGDLEGVKWATVGILRQAWTKDQIDVYQTARHVADATLDDLRVTRRAKDYANFKAALDEAVVRDVAVDVVWNGDADVDLLVEEPTGTVCSVQHPRTTSGGVLIGDTTSPQGRQELGTGAKESYVCPQAFNGTYRVLIRRAWGKLVANRVEVRLSLHQFAKNQFFHKEYITLDKDEAVVAFDLRDGRRKESLKEQQVATAVAGQLAVNRQILGQQLAAAIDPNALQAFALSRTWPTSATAANSTARAKISCRSPSSRER